MAFDTSIRAYARHRGVSHVAVLKAVRAGRIQTQDGKIDVELADRMWAENTDQAQTRRAPRPNPPAQRAMPASAPLVPPRPTGFAAARAVREGYDARLRELDYKLRVGELVSADEVRVAAFNSNRRARDLLLAVPDRLAAILAGTTDQSEVHNILREEIQRACAELSDGLFPNEHGNG